MPELGFSHYKKVILPSKKGTKDEAWVEINMGVPVSAVIDISDIDKNSERILKFMAGMIHAWNFTENGKPVPITVENIKRMSANDFVFLANSFSLEKLGNLDKAKKKP